MLADKLLVNGQIHTGDASGPRASALAIVGERVLAVGDGASGKLADPVVLDCDIFTCDPMAIAETRVLATMIGGKFVWEDGHVSLGRD
jgi:predicted amidohydrolase YtcJ